MTRSRCPTRTVRPRALVPALALALAMPLITGAADVPHPSGTVTVVPTNCNDAGPGSLRDALATPAALLVVDLEKLACSTISLSTGALVVPATTPRVTVAAAVRYVDGRPTPALTIDANRAGRVIEHHADTADARMILRGVALVDGRATDSGGCVHARGELRIIASTVSGCEVAATGSTRATGGAIHASGPLDLTFVRVADGWITAESGYAYGGGVFAAAGVELMATQIDGCAAPDGYGGGLAVVGSARVRHSTIAHNGAAFDGGIALFGGGASPTLVIENSTISGNAARVGSGAGSAWSDIRLSHATIAGNGSSNAGSIGGLFLNGAQATLEASLLAGNLAGATPSDLGGVGTVGGDHSLVVASALALPADTLRDDPRLDTFGDHGGFTDTYALRADSPAIDRGSPIAPALFTGADQRYAEFADDGQPGPYYERRVGPAEDIGAYESGAPDLVFADGFEWPHPPERPADPGSARE